MAKPSRLSSSISRCTIVSRAGVRSDGAQKDTLEAGLRRSRSRCSIRLAESVRVVEYAEPARGNVAGAGKRRTVQQRTSKVCA